MSVQTRSPDIRAVAGILHRLGPVTNLPEVLLFQRNFKDHGGGLFEFPGGKIEKGESEVQALQRELIEEISIKVSVQERLGSAQFQVPSGRIIELVVYFVTGPVEQIQLLEHEQMKWVTAQTVVVDELSLGDRPLIKPCFEVLKNFYGKS